MELRNIPVMDKHKAREYERVLKELRMYKKRNKMLRKKLEETEQKTGYVFQLEYTVALYQKWFADRSRLVAEGVYNIKK